MLSLHSLTFFAFMMAFVSMWICRSVWIWGTLLIISYFLALETSTVTPLTILPIGLVASLFWILHKSSSLFVQWVSTLILILLAIGLNFHWIPGFHNWRITTNFWLNYDKPFIGFFALAWLIPLIQTKREWPTLSKTAIPLTLLTIIVLTLIALIGRLIVWELKIPSQFLLRLVTNLIFVTIPEEAFFRGFLQVQLYKTFKPSPINAILSILCVSLIFALFHLNWSISFFMLFCVFLAGIFYGGIYHYTRHIEASIFCHFMVNVTHMVFFTYPML